MTPVFAEEEYSDRIARFQARLQQLEVDVAIINTPENICYLVGHETSGYYTYQCLIVRSSGAPTLLSRVTETENARETSYLENIVGYADVDDPIATTASVVKSLAPRAATVGMEARSWFLVPEQYEALAAEFSPSAIRRLDDEIAQLRLIKSAAEVVQIRAAAEITNRGVRAAALAAVPGARERDVAAVAFAEMIREGSEYVGMEPFVASGPRAGTIHASWSDRVIQRDEGILLEMSATKGRYNAPLMHTVWSGELQGDSARMAEACLAARDATLALVGPGHTPAEAHLQCRATIEEFGLAHTYRKRSGYSVGIAFAPDWGEGHILSLKETEHREFQPGMVVHVVPTLRLAGIAGQGFSATVLVTESGHEVLTSCDILTPGGS